MKNKTDRMSPGNFWLPFVSPAAISSVLRAAPGEIDTTFDNTFDNKGIGQTNIIGSDYAYSL